MLENQSPIVRRLVMFWLPIMVVIGVFLYLSQTHYDAQKEAQYGLQRLNFWRRQAGLPVLERQAALEQAAQKHAQYLTHNPDGHDERNRSNPHFTGADPQERANAAGYPAAVSENLTISHFARSGKRSVDSLMTALYHRLSLLNPDQDEAGVAWVRGKNSAFVLESGSSQERQLCEQNHSAQAKYILTMICHNKKVEIHVNQAPIMQKMAVKYPIGSQIEPSYDGKEQPNPMPQADKTGNPISIAFYGETQPIQMISFKLFQDNQPINDVKILTASNDINRLLAETEFALFPMKSLEFDKDYRVEFAYRQNNQDKIEKWQFHTRKKKNIFEF